MRTITPCLPCFMTVTFAPGITSLLKSLRVACSQVMQCEAQAVADWAKLNGLELNLKKSKVMLLGSEAYIKSDLLNLSKFPPIQENNNPLQKVNTFKNLGM